jgi:phosphoserine phosphatase
MISRRTAMVMCAKMGGAALVLLGLLFTPTNSIAQLAPTDPLPSWNAGPAKTAIQEFVQKTTSEGSAEFVPQDERIAVFDNDGTLWPENPLPFEVAFALDEAKAMLAAKPKLLEQPAYQALAGRDIAALTDNHLKLLLQLVMETHTGRTTAEFEQSVAAWIATAQHPRFGKLYSECTYQPMQEVLKLLRTHGYRTYIVSGGGQEFMRVWAQQVYDVPPEQVIGSVLKTKYELLNDQPTLTIVPELALLDDKAGKPVAIHHLIGRTPVMCFGNSDGDHEMLQMTTIGRQPSFGLIVHHTDADREYAYDAQPKSSGKLIEALAAAPQRGWIVVDMQRDWNRVFSFAQ